ncbi:heptaprenyl diphosphate synthase component 1 [Virgibacillus halotolerans]|uniref:heptaprenyl diphosphate synthase component 1 n=1 Tax=Virgibacillus halotolerans TaxID=1071053 RepID=UPI001960D4E4|nr:heptaprenyl diphosphate synthase component 1 [Virgibacillus halotolerans]
MNTSTMEIRHLKARIEDKIYHSYLKKYIPKPVIDEEKLIILAAIINNTHLSTIQKEQYIITTMLVQVALDTHELVPVSNDPNESNELILSKQLSVLAGDYFSGLYYLLLAEIEDFDLIHILASAIKEINENKMKLYYNEINSLRDHIQILGKIESLLILHVADYVKDVTMARIAEEWVMMNRLCQEKSKMNNNDFSSLLSKELNVDTMYETLLHTVDDVIKLNAIHVDKMLVKLPASQVAFKVHANVKLKALLYNCTTIAEEG